MKKQIIILFLIAIHFDYGARIAFQTTETAQMKWLTKPKADGLK